MPKKDSELTCVLDRYENSRAVLRFNLAKDDFQELIIARRYLPKNIKEGDIIYLELYSDKEATERKKNIARQILEEILKGE